MKNEKDALKEIIAKRSYRNGKFTLASGKTSDHYFDLKPTMMNAQGLGELAWLMYNYIWAYEPDYVASLELGAVPLVSAVVGLSANKGTRINGLIVRKQAKDHGSQNLIEGLAPGESLVGKRVVVLEDTTTTGNSSLKAVTAIKEAGGTVVQVLTVIDREEGADELYAIEHIDFNSLFKSSEFEIEPNDLIHNPWGWIWNWWK